jgi:hypothetical protein
VIPIKIEAISSLIIGVNCNGKTYHESRRCEQPLAASIAWREAIQAFKSPFDFLDCFATLATTDAFTATHQQPTATKR